MGEDDVYLSLNARLLKNMATEGQCLPRLCVEDKVNRTRWEENGLARLKDDVSLLAACIVVVGHPVPLFLLYWPCHLAKTHASLLDGDLG